MVTFSCGCGKELRARDELAGKKTHCPQCTAILRIPETEVVAASREEQPGAELDDGSPYGLMIAEVTPTRVRSSAGIEPEADSVLAPSSPSPYYLAPESEKPTRFRSA